MKKRIFKKKNTFFLFLKNEERFAFSDPNPFVEGDAGEIASVAYRYRKWDLGNDIKLIIRSEIDAVTTGPNEERLFLNVKALNEWDSKVILFF
jgi:translation initiation factor 3 subunit D